MTKAYIKNIKKKVNVIEKPNPYPEMADKTPHFKADDYVKSRLHINYGNVANVFPYKKQDLYSDELITKSIKTVVLENEYIKAVFLPQYGARLMSIYDKKRKKDIVYNNDAIRITNVALRNAWFAGGVEWNSSVRGHTPFTCDNLFCEIIENGDEPVVRFYEWERIRKQFFEITAYLPNDSRQLFIKIRIINCNKEETPAYWWSNIAVKETFNTRVITNCEKTFGNDYEGQIVHLDVPYRECTDITYPVRNLNAVDYFFDTYDDKQRFIMTAEEDGDAFYQTSTSFLKGRKEFVWGMAQGSFNWQRKLCGEGSTYFEVQAGLARTQMECAPMPGGAVWEWTEAYGMTKADKEKIYSTDWNIAREEGARCVAEVNEERLEAVAEEIKRICRNKGELVHKGSAWASLEKLLNYSPVYDEFAEIPLESEQKPWAELIKNNKFICPRTVNDNPAGYIYDKKLKAALEKYAGENWYAYFHLGLMYYYEKNFKKARTSFEISIKLKENPWALYALSELSTVEKDYEAALEYILKVVKIRPDDIRALRKLSDCACAAGRGDEYTDIYEKLPVKLKNNTRLKLLAAISYIECGDIGRFEEILSVPFEPNDIREGEKSFAKAWEKYLEIKYFKPGMTEEEKKKISKMHPVPRILDYGTRV